MSWRLPIGLLEAVANQRLMLQRNFYRLNKKEIELGRKKPHTPT